jgi:hypothetical protein
MKTVDSKNIVDRETLKVYDDIDGLKVIEDYLLFKGTSKKENGIHLSDLEKMALITYGLKVNATNKLYVGWHLDKFYKRNGLFRQGMKVVDIPADIYDRVDAIHKQYRTELP